MTDDLDVLLPPLADGLTIAPSALGQFIRFEQCQRRFRLDLYSKDERSRLFQQTGTEAEVLPPLLSATGSEWEIDFRDKLIGAGWTVRDMRAEPDERSIDRIRRTKPGQRRVFREATLSGSLDGWRIEQSRPDMIFIERTESDELRLMVADLKSSRDVRLEHRLQVSMYAMLLAQLIPEAVITEAVIYRTPIESPETWSTETLQHREAARTLLNVTEGAMLALADRPERYHDQIRRTILAPGSLAREMASSQFSALPFHLSAKCDGCAYSQLCLKSCRATGDISLVAHLTERTKRSLQALDITSVTDLATMRESHQESYAALMANPSVGPLLSELAQRARSFIAWQERSRPIETWLPGSGHSTLPYASATQHANLIKVYIDLQLDVSQGRVYLASALVSCLAGGVERPDRRQHIVEIAKAPLETDEQEAELIRDWLRQVLQAVNELSTPNENGEKKAPVHFYLWDNTQLTILEQLVNRQHDAVFGVDAVMTLMMQVAAFDSNNLSIVASEVRAQRTLPMLCQSLQAVAPWFRYRWPDEIKTRFRFRLFDALSQESDQEDAHLVPNRSRFRSDIPTEYAYVAWNAHTTFRSDEQPDPEVHRTSWGLYGHPTREDIVAFQHCRLDALEAICAGLRANNRARKTSFDLQCLERLKVRPDKLIEAVQEFIAIERHQELSDWRRIRSQGQNARVVAGETLVVRYRDEDQIADVRIRIREARERQERWEARRSADPDAPPDKDDRWSLDDIELCLSVDETELPDSISMETMLLNTRIKDESYITLAPARSSFTPENAVTEVSYQTTARQILGGFRGVVTKIGADGTIAVDLRDRSQSHPGFIFPRRTHPPEDGEVWIIDESPDSWPWKRQWDVSTEIKCGRPHAAYEWIAGASATSPSWTDPEAEGQARYFEGLRLLTAVDDRVPKFEQSKQEFIGSGGGAAMTLVQGPPGTGKSTTTGYALWARMHGALAAGRPFRVAVACKTHSATDVIVQSILKAQMGVIDIGRNQGPEIDSHIDQRTRAIPVYRFEPKGNPPAGARLVKDSRAETSLREILAYDHVVVGGTTNAICKLAWKAWKNGDPPWDLIIVDEASQMSLPEFLVASIGLKPDGRVIVVGDHRQMPPIVKSNWEEGDTVALDPYAAYRSVFDVIRFSPQPKVEIKFTESFRIHRDIAEYLRQEVYQFDQIEFYSKKTPTFSSEVEEAFASAVLGSSAPLILVTHDERGSQQRNPVEERLIEAIMLAIPNPDDPRKVGVVVPHRAQRVALRKRLLELTGSEELANSVDTIERFQGNERRIIIYGATESDPAYLRDTGTFLFDPRRITVSLSRATHKLIVVASESVFEYLPPDEESLENTSIWRNLRTTACPEVTWEGLLSGYRVSVHPSIQLVQSDVGPGSGEIGRR